jgi:hypothetical protein
MVEDGEIVITAVKQTANEAEHLVKEAVNDDGKDPSEAALQETERAMKQAAFLGSKAVSHAASGWGNSSKSKEEEIDIC